MASQASIFVLVPAYNEGPVIRKTVQELLAAGYHVVLIDDASTDQTAQVLADLAIDYIRHPVNLGQGAALMTGMIYARQADADYVVHFDGDGQHQVKDIPALLAPLQADQADISLGSRFLQASPSQSMPLSRKWLLKTAIWVNGLFTGLWLTDAHNGLRALNRKALHSIQLKENRMAHATEILGEIRRHQLRYQEVPVSIRYSAYSLKKGQSALSSLRIMRDLIRQKIFPL